jgi:hypothetical protein
MCKVALLAIDDSALQSLSARRPSPGNPATRLLPRFEPFVFYSRNCDGFCRWETEKPLRACLGCTTESITGWDEKRKVERAVALREQRSPHDGSAYRTTGGGTEWTMIVRSYRLRVRP